MSKQIKLTLYARNFFITDKDKLKYKKNPEICAFCKKPIKSIEELDYFTLISRRYFSNIISLPVHIKCKKKDKGESFDFVIN